MSECVNAFEMGKNGKGIRDNRSEDVNSSKVCVIRIQVKNTRDGGTYGYRSD